MIDAKVQPAIVFVVFAGCAVLSTYYRLYNVKGFAMRNIKVGRVLYFVTGEVETVTEIIVYIRSNGATEVKIWTVDNEGAYHSYNQNQLHAMRERGRVSTEPMAAHRAAADRYFAND